jgi:predicted TIM-barrel fold metal-dependent hydrolase
MGHRTEDLRSGKPYIVVSADTHAAPETFEEYLGYVEPAHREAIASVGELDLSAIRAAFGGHLADATEFEHPDPVRATANWKASCMGVDTSGIGDWLDNYRAAEVFANDAGGKRLQALEDQGIHGEVTYPGPMLTGVLSAAMFSQSGIAGMHNPTTDHVYWPALQAYNRWLADFCAAAPGRRAGVIQVDLRDLDAAVAEIRWAREAGISGGVMLPGMSLHSGLRGYTDEYFDPFWSACEEYDMVVNIHTGAAPTDAAQLYDAKHGGNLGIYEVLVFSRRPLWFMVLGGVFDRHPKLKVVVSENGVHWYPSLVHDMEFFFDTYGAAPIRASLRRRPVEYFHDHVFLGGSLMQPSDAEMRHRIGINQLMWGSDYPHLEGSAPVNRQAMRYVLGGLPEEEIRQILGANAIDVWGFDERLLQDVADRVGPTVEDLATPISLDDIPPTFGWNFSRPVPLPRQPALAG